MTDPQKINNPWIKDRFLRTGHYIRALMVSIALSSKVVVLENYQSSNLFGRIFELAKVQFCGNTITFAFLFVVLASIFKTRFELKEKKIIIKILAAIFACFYIIGRSFAEYNNLKYIVGNTYQFGFAIFYFCGYIIFFSYCINYLMYIIEKNASNDINKFNTKIEQKFIQKNDKTLFFLFIICWLPYLIICYPGSVPYDGYRQLNMFYGINQATNHHPWFSTLVMGSLHWIGKHVSDNFGVFTFVLIQSVFCAYVFSRICKKIISYEISKKIKVISVLFYAIVPTWGAYAQALIKDTIYYSLFALFMIYYIEIIETGELKNRRLILFLMISCMVELYRNEAIYILFLSFLGLIISLNKKDYRKLVLSVAVILLINAGFKQIVFPMFDVQEGSVKEMLSIPFQQTARYVIKHEEELTEDEIEIINQVLSYKVIKQKYDPNISDPVKNTYRNPSKEILIEYFKLWILQFMKDPKCYIEAALNHSFGYVYPEYVSKNLGAMQFYIMGKPVATGDLDIYYVHNDKRNIMSNYAYLWMKIPLLSLLMFPAAYTWILFFLAALMIRKNKWRDLIACLPLLLTIGICIISPVNGYVRYMLPVMAATPLLVGYSLNIANQGNDSEEISECLKKA